MGDEVEFYATPGAMSDLRGYDEALVGMPSDPHEVATVVQGLIVHPFLVSLYELSVPPGRDWDVQVRPVSGIVDRLLQSVGRPLVERREPADRFFGNCRHFSLLTVSLLRHAGVPARARCGFGGYFEPDKWVDHWVVEHWDGERWVMLDAQIDERQRLAFGLEDDPENLPPARFLPAGKAWLRCQAGDLDGARFGILDEWGQWFIKGNIARDLAALNKVEMLPWDVWWSLEGPDDLAPGAEALVDEVAALSVSGDVSAIRDRFLTDADLRVPPRVLAAFTPDGPTEVDVRTLVGALPSEG